MTSVLAPRYNPARKMAHYVFQDEVATVKNTIIALYKNVNMSITTLFAVGIRTVPALGKIIFVGPKITN